MQNGDSLKGQWKGPRRAQEERRGEERIIPTAAIGATSLSYTHANDIE
jgi:hypothetical protein